MRTHVHTHAQARARAHTCTRARTHALHLLLSKRILRPPSPGAAPASCPGPASLTGCAPLQDPARPPAGTPPRGPAPLRTPVALRGVLDTPSGAIYLPAPRAPPATCGENRPALGPEEGPTGVGDARSRGPLGMETSDGAPRTEARGGPGRTEAPPSETDLPGALPGRRPGLRGAENRVPSSPSPPEASGENSARGSPRPEACRRPPPQSVRLLAGSDVQAATEMATLLGHSVRLC